MSQDPEAQVKITVYRGMRLIHEATIPWSQVAMEEIRWTRPLGANRNRNRFSAKLVQPEPQTVISAGVTYTICPVCEYARTGPDCPMCRDRQFAFFDDQLDAITSLLAELGAVIEIAGRLFVDESKIPAPARPGGPDLLDTYRGLLAFGHTHHLLDGYTSEAVPS
jgi:hypothetical protein